MNILSLPDELMDILLKYMDFHDILNMRKTNARINRVAQRTHHSHKLEAELVFGEFNPTSNHWSVTVELGKKLQTAYNLPDDGFVHNFGLADDYFSILENYLTTLGSIREIWFFEHVVFDEELLDILMKFKKSFRKCKSLNFHLAPIFVSIARMKCFVDICPKLKTITMCLTPTFCKVINTQVLQNRKWDLLEVREISQNQIGASELDDEFLLKVVKNCKKFQSQVDRSETEFTFDGVWELIQETISDGVTGVEWRLDVVRSGDIASSERKRRLESIPNVELSILKFQSRGPRDYDKYKVKFPLNDDLVQMDFDILRRED